MGLRSTPHDAQTVHIHPHSQTVAYFIRMYLENRRAMDNIHIACRDDEVLMRNLYMELLKKERRLQVHKAQAHSGVCLNEMAPPLQDIVRSVVERAKGVSQHQRAAIRCLLTIDPSLVYEAVPSP